MFTDVVLFQSEYIRYIETNKQNGDKQMTTNNQNNQAINQAIQELNDKLEAMINNSFQAAIYDLDNYEVDMSGFNFDNIGYSDVSADELRFEELSEADMYDF